jgi:hypothetical protein
MGLRVDPRVELVEKTVAIGFVAGDFTADPVAFDREITGLLHLGAEVAHEPALVLGELGAGDHLGREAQQAPEIGESAPHVPARRIQQGHAGPQAAALHAVLHQAQAGPVLDAARGVVAFELQVDLGGGGAAARDPHVRRISHQCVDVPVFHRPSLSRISGRMESSAFNMT